MGLFVVVWTVLAIAIGFWADSRGRSGLLYFFVSWITSPLLAGLVLLLSANLRKEQERREDDARVHERHLEEIRALATNKHGEGAPVSLADELQKLAELKEKGVLTDAEFQRQKEKLLS